MVDIAGNLGAKVVAPKLTNLDNTVTVSAHGGQLSGFSPDESATNSLAKAVKEKIDSGGQLSLEDIAQHIGPATNSIKRAIIDACFAAGYNFNSVKKLFPNLEQLVAPSTANPVSAVYLPYLLQKETGFNQHSISNISPFFSVTPTKTNVVRQASDWLPAETVKKVAMPLSMQQAEWKKKFGEGTNVWNESQYSGKSARPAEQIKKELDSLQNLYRQKLSAATNNAQIDMISAEWKKAISSVFE